MPDLAAARKILRISNWLSLAGLVVVIILVLHKSPAPTITYDPAAAKRVEQKFAAANQAKAAGQPAQVQMTTRIEFLPGAESSTTKPITGAIQGQAQSSGSSRPDERVGNGSGGA